MLALQNNNTFSWSSLGDINDGRENLGADMPVYVYRLMQYTLRAELVRRYGNDAYIDVFRASGELAGKEFATHMLNLALPLGEFIAHLQEELEKSKIGVLRLEEFDELTGAAVLTVGEDLDCSGLPVTGETVCNYDEGFLAGVLKAYTKKDYVVTEIDCWATGARVCRFKAYVQNKEDS